LPKALGGHEHCVKVGSCSVKVQEERRASWPRALRTVIGLTRARLLPPTFHNLQADLSAQQTGIGWVIPQGARRQVKLVDERGRR
jgi:hypothetical protein